MMRIAGLVVALAVPAMAAAQVFRLTDGNVQKRANGALALMGFTLIPDVTTGSLAISSAPTQNPDFQQTTLGGGDTVHKRLYLEGTVGTSRYDPTFVASDGVEQRDVSVKWRSVSATGGIGYDFPIAQHLVIRPVLNVSIGRVESEAAGSVRIASVRAGEDVAFAQDGRLDVYGVGGAVMLDYEDYQPRREIDAELRFTAIPLRSYGDTDSVVKGTSHANSISFWTRWRAPTGAVMLDRPLRYVLEYAHTSFVGSLDGVLGFNHLNSFGVGLELDTSRLDTYVTRARAVMRYVVGQNVEGWSLGLAVSF
ncbi:hypothetical protein [Usitatibacter palustris]|uniref:Autotransporter domain-containing protein n=1 Tax=Usitatibacter palustris TaxID=2732487 RepID=A0A6M4H744_9PROT|nr:hypothetical protein [Usitatibacter palustris]QJR15416.1 hypothetical protein DSM104440_02235 [Usitatibacter palustris]